MDKKPLTCVKKTLVILGNKVEGWLSSIAEVNILTVSSKKYWTVLCKLVPFLSAPVSSVHTVQNKIALILTLLLNSKLISIVFDAVLAA